jgi:hypothetical protein
MIGGAGSRHRRRRSSPGVHFAAQQVARLAALNQQRESNGDELNPSNESLHGGGGQPGEGPTAALARRRSSK